MSGSVGKGCGSPKTGFLGMKNAFDGAEWVSFDGTVNASVCSSTDRKAGNTLGRRGAVFISFVFVIAVLFPLNQWERTYFCLVSFSF